MLSAFAGGGGGGGVGGVFDGRGGGAALAPPPPQFSASNFIPIRLDSQDPERKRVRDELVVRQGFSFHWFVSVLGIPNRNRTIRMFLGHPDPLVRGMDPAKIRPFLLYPVCVERTAIMPAK
jgi:hypothetical protein